MKPGSHGESSAEKKQDCIFLATLIFCDQKKKAFI